MRKDYWQSLKGSQLEGKHGDLYFVAGIDPSIGITIKDMQTQEDVLCLRMENRFGLPPEQRFDLYLGCILAGYVDFDELSELTQHNGPWDRSACAFS